MLQCSLPSCSLIYIYRTAVQLALTLVRSFGYVWPVWTATVAMTTIKTTPSHMYSEKATPSQWIWSRGGSGVICVNVKCIEVVTTIPSSSKWLALLDLHRAWQWASHSALLRNSQTFVNTSKVQHRRFWLSISGNSSEKFHCGMVVNMPYYPMLNFFTYLVFV